MARFRVHVSSVYLFRAITFCSSCRESTTNCTVINTSVASTEALGRARASAVESAAFLRYTEVAVTPNVFPICIKSVMPARHAYVTQPVISTLQSWLKCFEPLSSQSR